MVSCNNDKRTTLLLHIPCWKLMFLKEDISNNIVIIILIHVEETKLNANNHETAHAGTFS